MLLTCVRLLLSVVAQIAQRASHGSSSKESAASQAEQDLAHAAAAAVLQLLTNGIIHPIQILPLLPPLHAVMQPASFPLPSPVAPSCTSQQHWSPAWYGPPHVPLGKCVSRPRQWPTHNVQVPPQQPNARRMLQLDCLAILTVVSCSAGGIDGLLSMPCAPLMADMRLLLHHATLQGDEELAASCKAFLSQLGAVVKGRRLAANEKMLLQQAKAKLKKVPEPVTVVVVVVTAAVYVVSAAAPTGTGLDEAKGVLTEQDTFAATADVTPEEERDSDPVPEMEAGAASGRDVENNGVAGEGGGDLRGVGQGQDGGETEGGHGPQSNSDSVSEVEEVATEELYSDEFENSF